VSYHLCTCKCVERKKKEEKHARLLASPGQVRRGEAKVGVQVFGTSSSAILHREMMNKGFEKCSTSLTHLQLHQACVIVQTKRCFLNSTVFKEEEGSYILFSQIISFILTMTRVTSEASHFTDIQNKQLKNHNFSYYERKNLIYLDIQNKQLKNHNFSYYERKNLIYLDILILLKKYTTFPYLNRQGYRIN
jgi:hypothetical protein